MPKLYCNKLASSITRLNKVRFNEGYDSHLLRKKDLCKIFLHVVPEDIEKKLGSH